MSGAGGADVDGGGSVVVVGATVVVVGATVVVVGAKVVVDAEVVVAAVVTGLTDFGKGAANETRASGVLSSRGWELPASRAHTSRTARTNCGRPIPSKTVSHALGALDALDGTP